MERVIRLIHEKQYEQAVLYGDDTAKTMALKNESWDEYTKNVTYTSNPCFWTIRSWGNLATFIFYGSRFEDKKAEIKRLKRVLSVLSSYGALPSPKREEPNIKRYDLSDFVVY